MLLCGCLEKYLSKFVRKCILTIHQFKAIVLQFALQKRVMVKKPTFAASNEIYYFTVITKRGYFKIESNDIGFLVFLISVHKITAFNICYMPLKIYIISPLYNLLKQMGFLF